MFAPALGAILILCVGNTATYVRVVAGLTVLVELALSVAVFIGYDSEGDGPQLVDRIEGWIPFADLSGKTGSQVQYFLGVDGLSAPLILLTAIIVCSSLYFSYQTSKSKHNALVEVSKHIDDPSQLEELIKSLEEKQEPSDPRRNGVVIFFTGMGIYIFGVFVTRGGLEGVGLLVAAIGAGIVIAGYLFPRGREKS